MREFIDMDYPPHIEESDDGILIHQFRSKTGVYYYVVADYKHTDGKGDRRDIFYDENCPTSPLLYSRLIRYLCKKELYRGFTWEDARKAMG